MVPVTLRPLQMPDNDNKRKIEVKRTKIKATDLQIEVAKSKILEAAFEHMRKQPGFNPDTAVFDLEFGLHF